MNKRFWRVVLAVALVGSVAGCANQKAPPLETFQPVPVNPSAHFKKFDTFVVVLDTASSMDGSYRNRLEADRTREIVSRMNRMIPDMGYRSALVAFRSGSCLSCEDAVLLYGPVPYNRDEFKAGLAAYYREAGEINRVSPKGGDMPAARAILQGNPGRVALIVVTDSENILQGRAFTTVQKLSYFLGGRLCIYPIQVDRYVAGHRVVDELVKVGGCGFSVYADEIATPNAMAAYVNQIFLASAAAPVAQAPVSVVVDSDGDGVPDSRDKCPNTPKGVKVNDVGCWELNGVFFDSDQAVIKDTRALDEAVAILKANPNLTGEVQGHTDSTASAEYNQKLSEARARAVRDYFIRQGIAPVRIRAIGFGETRPAVSNETLEGRALNRRVELHPAFGHK